MTTISDPSSAVNEINIPVVSNFSSNFVYNYYTKDERISIYKASPTTSLQKLPRAVVLSWTPPAVSSNFIYQAYETKTQKKLEDNYEKILTEDTLFNPGYINHIFSDISSIEQGSYDLENLSRISQDDTESLAKMASSQIRNVASTSDLQDQLHSQHLDFLTDGYQTLSDLPQESMGLKVYDESGRMTDKNDLLRSLYETVSIDLKINNMVVPDIFFDYKNKDVNLDQLKLAYSSRTKQESEILAIPVQNSSATYNDSAKQPSKIIGYTITRYRINSGSYTKEKTYYVNDPFAVNFIDKEILYGISYLYSISVIASVVLLTQTVDKNQVNISELYVGSKQSTSIVSCFEDVPPPPPDDIKFSYDYEQGNLLIQWSNPVNHQGDIKQYQIFRRKSINNPFELIAQYGFDTSYPGGPNNSKYTTGEIVDANNYLQTPAEYRGLIKTTENPVNFHRDKEFTIDTEFHQNQSYIYTICSIDAHGLISNYSAQHEVIFDVYKNRITSKLICDSGSPRQYPNMRLRVDAFKDALKISGDESKKMTLYFTPEYLLLKDGSSRKYKVVEAMTANKNNRPYYVIQMINLDNQKGSLIKININDMSNLTAQ